MTGPQWLLNEYPQYKVIESFFFKMSPLNMKTLVFRAERDSHIVRKQVLNLYEFGQRPAEVPDLHLNIDVRTGSVGAG